MYICMYIYIVLYMNTYLLYVYTVNIIIAIIIIINITKCIGAHKVDLVWSPIGTKFEDMAITGYQIAWYQPKFPSRVSNTTVGNVTTTSIRELNSNSTYVFSISALSEGLVPIR
jgi:hypothetical protein